MIEFLRNPNNLIIQVSYKNNPKEIIPLATITSSGALRICEDNLEGQYIHSIDNHEVKFTLAPLRMRMCYRAIEIYPDETSYKNDAPVLVIQKLSESQKTFFTPRHHKKNDSPELFPLPPQKKAQIRFSFVSEPWEIYHSLRLLGYEMLS